MPAVNPQFQQYVTGTSFNLSMSQNMISALSHLAYCQAKEGGWAEFDRLIWSAKDPLIRRGLITNINSRGADLTEAGKLVLQLCQIAGLA